MATHSAHSTTPGGDSHAHGHGHGAHDVKKAVRTYMVIFGALLVGTVITVAASYVHFGAKDSNTWNIIVALIIATVKASLVAGYFMHLLDERKLIYGVLGATAFFAVGLVYLTLWSMEPGSFIHIKK